MDFLFVATTLVFAAATVGFIAVCGRVEKRP